MSIQSEQELCSTIKSDIISVLKNYHLYVDDDVCQESIKKFTIESKEICDFTKSFIIGEEFHKIYSEAIGLKNPPCYLEQFSRIFAFGYNSGDLMIKVLGGNSAERYRAGVLSGLFNLYSCLFDFVCDNHKNLIPDLCDIVNLKSLTNALLKEKVEKEFFKVSSSRSQDFILRFISCLMNEYFNLLHNEILWQNSNRIRIELKKSILQSYYSEIKSIRSSLEIDPILNDIHLTLFNKSALPAWIICLNSILCLKNEFEDLDKLKMIMLDIGKSIWIIDDLTDISEDIDCNYWNYLLLKLYHENGITVHTDKSKKTKIEIYNVLLETGTIKKTVKEMCECYIESIRSLRKISHNTLELEMNLLVWINGWLRNLK